MVSSLDALNISHNYILIHAPITQTNVSTDTPLKLTFCIFPLSKHPIFDVALCEKKTTHFRASPQYFKNLSVNLYFVFGTVQEQLKVSEE